MSSSPFEEFLNKVISKVKAKETHSIIKKELANHLQELSSSFEKRDISKEEAEKKAIEEMGNPFTIGENLNRLHQPKIDWLLLSLFLIFTGISFLSLIRIEHVELAIHSPYLVRQAFWYILAVFVIVGCLFFDYRKLKNLWIFFYSSGFVLLLYTYLFSDPVQGTKRWFSLFGFSINVIITLLLFFLAWASIFHQINEYGSWKKQVLLSVLFWSPLFLYIKLPYFILSIIYFFCVVAMFAFSHANKKFAIKLIVTNIAACMVVISAMIILSPQSGYFFTKLSSFFNPYEDPSGHGYMYIVVRDALSQAGWFGHKLINDSIVQALPLTHTDFVFSYLVYAFGWAFGIFLCFVLLIFILRITFNAFKTKDLYGRLLVIGGAALFAVPICWNILMGFWVVPIIGVFLPFISYGGGLLLLYSAILGLILSVYRRKDMVEPTMINQ